MNNDSLNYRGGKAGYRNPTGRGASGAGRHYDTMQSDDMQSGFGQPAGDEIYGAEPNLARSGRRAEQSPRAGSAKRAESIPQNGNDPRGDSLSHTGAFQRVGSAARNGSGSRGKSSRAGSTYIESSQAGAISHTEAGPRAQMPQAGSRNAAYPAGSSGNAAAPARRKKPRVQKKSDFIKPTDIVRVKSGIDRPFLILVIILVCFGAIMVFSASYPSALRYKNDSYYYIKRHLVFVAVGFVAMFFAARFDYRWLRRITIPVFIGTLVLLVLVLAYGVASGKAQRWIQLGPVTIQPSEIMKFSLVILLALYIDRNQNRITNYKNFWQSSAYGMFYPFIIITLVCVLVAAEGHFSGTIILFMIGMIVIFAAGARKIWFGIGGGGAALLILIAILTTDYAKERINLWLHPENYEITGKIWQTMQGLYAVGSGGLLGVGLGNSRQKHLYVSAPQNDFIFSIIAEELGFIGAVLVIILFALLIWRGFVIALKAPDTFSSLVVIGITSQVAIQSLLNIGVVTNLIPNTGISLPFFSYGGSSIMMLLGEMGIVLSISRYSYQQK